MTTDTFDLSCIPDVATFLVHAIRLEEDAGRRFDELADSCETYGNPEVVALFRRMAHFSRLHLQDAKARAGFHDLPQLDAWAWGDSESPETASIMGAEPYVSVLRALEIALDSERRGQAFYVAALDGCADPEIKAMARDFAAEEAEHVAELETWLERHRAAA